MTVDELINEFDDETWVSLGYAGLPSKDRTVVWLADYVGADLSVMAKLKPWAGKRVDGAYLTVGPDPETGDTAGMLCIDVEV